MLVQWTKQALDNVRYMMRVNGWLKRGVLPSHLQDDQYEAVTYGDHRVLIEGYDDESESFIGTIYVTPYPTQAHWDRYGRFKGRYHDISRLRYGDVHHTSKRKCDILRICKKIQSSN